MILRITIIGIIPLFHVLLFSLTGFLFRETDFNGYSCISEPVSGPEQLQVNAGEWKVKK